MPDVFMIKMLFCLMPNATLLGCINCYWEGMMTVNNKVKHDGLTAVILSLFCSLLWANPNIDRLPVSAAQFESMCSMAEIGIEQQLLLLEADGLASSSLAYLETHNNLLLKINDTAKLSNLFESVHPDSDIRNAAEVCTQKLDKLSNKINLSKPLYERIQKIDTAELSSVDRFLVAGLLRNFRLSGVDKDEATREKITLIQERIVKVGQQFDKTIRDDVRYLELDSFAQLAGLPADYVETHQPDDSGKIKISTRYPDYIPFITYADDDRLRKQMYLLSRSRGYPENKEHLNTLLDERYQLAQLLGFKSYAEKITADKMIGSVAAAQNFIDKVALASTPALQRDLRTLLKRLQRQDSNATTVGRWQISYLEDKIKTEKFGMDAKLLRQYFSYEHVKQGVFDLIETLFDVQFKPWQTSVWHDSVEGWELWDGDVLVGRFYLDMHPRQGKYQHAAMFPTQTGVKDVQVPVATLVCNFPGLNNPAEKMEFAQVQTFLHEFGHLLHELFAGNNRWVAHSGIATEWDFVEAPSQMLEEWLYYKSTLQSLALNDAGETISDAEFEQIQSARSFNKGVSTRIQMFYAALSLNFYNADPATFDLDELMLTLEKKYSAVEPMAKVPFYANFGHLNGYSAIYYTYMWSQVIATDMFSQFERDGVMNKALAKRYRNKVLAPGGSKPAAELVRDFLGRDYSFDSFAEQLNK